MADTLKQKILSGVFWQGAERIGGQVISFAISIVLARLLIPEDYGMVAVLLVFTALAGAFVDCGFQVALIQKKNLEESDCSSVFFINCFSGLIIYAILYFIAPWVGDFYNNNRLVWMLRILALNPIITGFAIVHRARLSREMRFDLQLRINWLSLISSAAVGISMAYLNAGPWAIIGQTLTSAVMGTVCYWLFIRWIPHWKQFHWNNIQNLFQFSCKILFVGLIDSFFFNGFQLLIGKFFDLRSLALYNRGEGLPKTGMMTISSTLGSVLFPAFSSIQDDAEQMKKLFISSVRACMFLVIPLMAFMACMARPVTIFLLTEKWSGSIIYMRIAAWTYVFWPMHIINLQVLQATGRSGTMVILEIIKKTLLLVIILCLLHCGCVLLACGMALSSTISFAANSWQLEKIIHFGFLKQTLLLLPMMVVAGISACAAFFAANVLSAPLWQILFGGTVFAVCYLGGCAVFGQIPPLVLKYTADLCVKARLMK